MDTHRGREANASGEDRIKQERVHFAFYHSQAERLLEESAAARRAHRFVRELRFEHVADDVRSRRRSTGRLFTPS
ncbi:MAG: hypothetical protein ACREPI_11190, partial [Candidatus Dormibacterales bacterium]